MHSTFNALFEEILD